jgi:hypothetical protein
MDYLAFIKHSFNEQVRVRRGRRPPEHASVSTITAPREEPENHRGGD